jgi:hypothetical protein
MRARNLQSPWTLRIIQEDYDGEETLIVCVFKVIIDLV